MDKHHFDQLVKGVKEMKRHIAGKAVRGAIVEEMPAPARHSDIPNISKTL